MRGVPANSGELARAIHASSTPGHGLQSSQHSVHGYAQHSKCCANSCAFNVSLQPSPFCSELPSTYPSQQPSPHKTGDTSGQRRRSSLDERESRSRERSDSCGRSSGGGCCFGLGAHIHRHCHLFKTHHHFPLHTRTRITMHRVGPSDRNQDSQRVFRTEKLLPTMVVMW